MESTKTIMRMQGPALWRSCLVALLLVPPLGMALPQERTVQRLKRIDVMRVPWEVAESEYERPFATRAPEERARLEAYLPERDSLLARVMTAQLRIIDEMLVALSGPRTRTTIVTSSCNANYSYLPSKDVVLLCYQFGDYVRRVTLLQRRAGAAISDSTDEGGVPIVAALHEIGHAAVAKQRVVLGNAEDAADGFAAYVLLAGPMQAEGAQLLFSTIMWLQGLQLVQDLNELDGGRWRDYTGSHPFPAQRADRLLCFLEGALGIAEENARQARCSREWNVLKRSWASILRR